MGSTNAQQVKFKNGDDSLSAPSSCNKRRKVSAIRVFPRGCGPKASRESSETTIDGSNGLKEDVGSKDVEVCEGKGSGGCEGDGKVVMNGFVEGQCHDAHICPDRVELRESQSEELQKLSVESRDTLRGVQTVEGRSLSKDEKHEPLLREGRVEIPCALKDFGVVDRTECADAVKNKKMEEGTSQLRHLLPHCPIPSTIVAKEPKYPPRKRVSAVRDFPAGCGRNVSRKCPTEDKDEFQGDVNANLAEAMPYRNEGMVNADGVSRLSGDTPETQIDIDESLAARMIVQEVLFNIKEQERVPNDNADIQCVKDVGPNGSGGRNDGNGIETLPEELNKDLIVYGKGKHTKSKKSVGVSSCRSVLQKEFAAGVESKRGVIVQGLICAASCPWREKKAEGNSSPSGFTAKVSKMKENDLDAGHRHKRSTNKRKKSAGKIAEKSMMIVPYVEETDTNADAKMYEACTPLAVRCGEYFSENEDLDDFQFLPRKVQCDVTLPPSFACNSSERGARIKVRETLRLFQVVVRKLLQCEETKLKEKGKTGKRIDISAANVMRDNGKYINTEKVIGPVPGVEIGDIFSYRIELAIIGLHSPLQSGIDTIKRGKQYVAISVVASGGYDNGIDSSDTLIYTGQGGNPTGPDKQPEDQKLERGNLALKNCIDEKTPVRVIRGFKEAKPADSSDSRPKMIATYTYDGLYSVERYWQDLGPHGKLVYKFELIRIPGQQELVWKAVKQSKKFKAREGRCVDDISEGREKLPICAVNTVDDELPPPFTYITKMIYPDWCKPIPLKGCVCRDGCSDTESCACAVKNGGEIPYNLNGAIVEAKSFVYECGSSCKCPSSCSNRVSQNGINLPLEIFKTESRGWGVRCLTSIPSGSFICEYIGELLDDKEAEQRIGSDEYLFDIGKNYSDPTLTDGLSAVMPDMASSVRDVVENVGFTIDAANYGNIGRFINHSCSPNLYAQDVLYDYEDKRIPHVALIAMENIPPLQELTYHYNYTIGHVFDSLGKIKRKDCYCGSVECTGRMY